MIQSLGKLEPSGMQPKTAEKDKSLLLIVDDMPSLQEVAKKKMINFTAGRRSGRTGASAAFTSNNTQVEPGTFNQITRTKGHMSPSPIQSDKLLSEPNFDAESTGGVRKAKTKQELALLRK